MKSNQIELIGLFSQEKKLDEYLESVKSMYSNMAFIYSRFDMFLAMNDPGKEHMKISSMADSLLLACQCLKKSSYSLLRDTYYSKEKRGVYEKWIESKMRNPQEAYRYAYIPASYESLRIMYEKMRSRTSGQLRALRNQNPSVSRHINMALDLINEYKQLSYDI